MSGTDTSGLRLSFTPEAIIEHFEDQPEPYAALLRAKLNSDEARFVDECWGALQSDSLYAEFHRLCVEIYESVTGEEYTGS